MIMKGKYLMWNRIFFNKQNIEHETDRGTLINMPNKSEYNGWKFWHPSKLVREEGGNGYFLSLSFTDDWKFRLFKSYKKKPNPQKNIGSEEIKIAFQASDESIDARVKDSSKSYLNVTEPTPVDKDVEVDDSLKR